MKQIKLFGKTYNIVPDNGEWKENCPKCDLFESCDSFNRTFKKQLCDTPTGGIGYYHFELVNKEE